jgi:hypothetical protein
LDLKYDKAIEIFYKGINAGDYDCYQRLGWVYFSTKHVDNFKKAYNKYFIMLNNDRNNESWFVKNAGAACATYINYSNILGLRINYLDTLRKYKGAILENYNEKFNFEGSSPTLRAYYKTLTKWVDANLNSKELDSALKIDSSNPKDFDALAVLPPIRPWWAGLFGRRLK